MLKICFCTVLSGCLFLQGCQYPGGRMELRGKVVDEKTGALIPGRNIIVYRLIPAGKKEIPEFSGQFSTDGTGHFSYILRKSKKTVF